MKTRLSLFCIALLVLLSANVADAQLVNSYGGGGFGGGGQQSGFQAVSSEIRQAGYPGRLWVEGNFADQGLGYSGSYFSVGAKSRLFQDRLDGRWLIQGQLNGSIAEDGGFFANIGLERVFTIDAARSDVSLAVFYDYDDDNQQTFSNGFNQVGVSGQIKTPRWDLIGNGYMPVSTDAYTLGDPFSINCFVGNNIALIPGIESALQGFDVTLRTRPSQLAMVNGTVDIGAYQYSSDLVDSFGGARFRLGFQLLNSIIVSAEVNNDERFDTTGMLSVGLIYGANASGYGSEYAGLGRDLEQISRNDHIVRFSQDLVLAVDPDTGMAYNVIHADNTADAVVGNGTYETPYATLADAEAGSAANDIIFVAGGDGTDRDYDTGIVLKDNQRLYSNGGDQFIPLPDGSRFKISGKPGSTVATISNVGGNEVVRLANNNVVGGLIIDGSGANFGILGTGVTDGEINGNTIFGATNDGIGLQNIQGDWMFVNNSSNGNLRDGVFINGAFDPTSNFTFDTNDFNNNGVDGLHLFNYDAETVTMTENTTSGNGRHGLYLQNGIAASGTDVLVADHIANANGGDGMRVDTGSGNLNIFNPTSTNNPGNGLTVRNWSNALPGDSTFIGGIEDQSAVFTGNGTGVSVELEGVGLVQDVLVTQSQIDSNGRGLMASAEGAGTVMNFLVVDNQSISNNNNEGIRMSVDDSGVINNWIYNTGTPLPLVNNNGDGGGTISYVLNGTGGSPASEINSVVRNVNINTGSGVSSGIDVAGVENSVIELDVADSTIRAGVAVAIDLDNNRNQLINKTYFDNVDIRGNIGVLGQSLDGTLWDFSLTNSSVQSNGILAGNGEVLDPNNPTIYTPYLDTAGAFGIVIDAVGGGPIIGNLFDNLTRVNLSNNVIRDFTFDGVTLTTSGDAQMLANIQANRIFNNGPGLNDDPNNDGTFPGPNSNAVNPTELNFHNGLTMVANGVSTLSVRLSNNALTNNFERGIVMQTTGQGTINASMIGNRLSNDIGSDLTNQFGIPFGSNVFDMDVFNSLNGNICLGMSNNTFRLLPINFQQAGIPGVPGLLVGLDGASNGFTNADLPGFVGQVGFGLCDSLIDSEELFFQGTGGFPAANH